MRLEKTLTGTVHIHFHKNCDINITHSSKTMDGWGQVNIFRIILLIFQRY